MASKKSADRTGGGTFLHTGPVALHASNFTSAIVGDFYKQD